MGNEIVQPLRFKSPNWKLRPPEVLKKDFHLLGAPAFERGYRQKPYASQDKLFPHFIKNQIYFYGVDWRKVSDPDSALYDKNSKFYVDPSWPRYTGCDLAGPNRRGTVIFTIAVSLNITSLLILLLYYLIICTRNINLMLQKL